MKKKRPRFIQQIIAFMTGSFWLPCPICNEDFGGHEKFGFLMETEYSGKLVCSDCVETAREMNEVKFGNPLLFFQKEEEYSSDKN